MTVTTGLLTQGLGHKFTRWTSNQTKPRRVPVSVTVRNSPKVNQRLLKKLKNRLLNEFKRKHGIKGRLDCSPIDGCREAVLWKSFHHFWNKWQSANTEKLHKIVHSPDIEKIYREMFYG